MLLYNFNFKCSILASIILSFFFSQCHSLSLCLSEKLYNYLKFSTYYGLNVRLTQFKPQTIISISDLIYFYPTILLKCTCGLVPIDNDLNLFYWSYKGEHLIIIYIYMSVWRYEYSLIVKGVGTLNTISREHNHPDQMNFGKMLQTGK